MCIPVLDLDHTESVLLEGVGTSEGIHPSVSSPSQILAQPWSRTRHSERQVLSSRSAFTDPARLPPCFNVLLSELSIEIWTISPKGHSLSGRKRELHLKSGFWKRFMVEASPTLPSAPWN